MTTKPTLFYVPPTINIAPGLPTPLGVPGTPLWDMLNQPFLDTPAGAAYDCQTITYPASLFDAGYSHTTGVANTIAAITALPPGHPFVLAGASQGAAIISAVYNDIRFGNLTGRRADFMAGVTFGNPCREGGHTFPGCVDPGGHGVRAAKFRLTQTEALWWDFAVPGDIIATNGDDYVAELFTAVFEYVWSQGLNGQTLPDEYAAAMAALTAAVNDALYELNAAPFTLVSQTFAGIIAALTWNFAHNSYSTFQPLPLNSSTCIELAANYLVQIASSPSPTPGVAHTPIYTPPTFHHMPPGRIGNYSAALTRMGGDAIIKLRSPGGRLTWHLAGGKAPLAGVDPGLVMQSLSGANAPFKLIDLQGARQHGVTNTDQVYDPMELDFTFSANGPLNPDMLPDPDGMRRVMRWWFETWADNRVSRVTYFTPELGEWWADARQFKPLPDQFKMSYAQTGEQVITWAARSDDAFWFSFDSADEMWFTGGPGETQDGHVTVSNRGTMKGHFRALFYGPGSVQFTEPLTGNKITFGPLLHGQVVLITTRPGLRSVIDVTPGQLPDQPLTAAQQVLKDLIEFVTNNNEPPLLQLFLSWAGIMPPQGNLYSLMQGRFASYIPGVEEAQPPVNTRIPVTFLPGVMRPAAYNGNSQLLPPTPGDTIEPVANVTRLVVSLTPSRVWPE